MGRVGADGETGDFKGLTLSDSGPVFLGSRGFSSGKARIDASSMAPFALSNSPCGRLAGYGGWWFWRHRHQQLGSYLVRIRSELA
jgi:hypothetical protein